MWHASEKMQVPQVRTSMITETKNHCQNPQTYIQSCLPYQMVSDFSHHSFLHLTPFILQFFNMKSSIQIDIISCTVNKLICAECTYSSCNILRSSPSCNREYSFFNQFAVFFMNYFCHICINNTRTDLIHLNIFCCQTVCI